MTHARTAPLSRWRHVAALALAAAIAAGAAVGIGATAAHADPIDPATANETIQVWVRADADKSPIAGVSALVDGEGFSETFVTGEDGKVVVGLPGPGDYTVTLDLASLPAGAGNPRIGAFTKSVFEGNKLVPANFLVSPDFPVPSETPGGSSDSPTTAPSAPTTDAEGGPVAPAGTNFWSLFASKVVTGLIFGLLIALAAIGLSLIYGTTGLNNFAHGELVTFGALIAYTFSGVLGWPAPLAIAMAVIAGGAFGWVQDAAIWKPLRKRGLGLVPLMIVTIGFSLALRYLLMFIWGPDRLTLPADPKPFLVIGPVSLRFTDVAGAVVSIVLLLLVAFVLQRTKIGKATRAVSDNRSLAAASGINVERVIRVVWVGGAALAAIGGVFIGYYQSLRWDTGGSILLLIFAAVTLGGLGTAYGALVGSLVIGVFINISTLWIPENLKYVAALVVMIVILLLRPQGILGKRERIG